jgi:hypothetical protein
MEQRAKDMDRQAAELEAQLAACEQVSVRPTILRTNRTDAPGQHPPTAFTFHRVMQCLYLKRRTFR